VPPVRHAAAGGALFRVGAASCLRHPRSLLLNAVFVALSMGILITLWSVVLPDSTFRGSGKYDFISLVWYLVIAQALLVPSLRLAGKISEELKDGTVGYRLLQPMPFVFSRLASYLGEAVVTLVVTGAAMALAASAGAGLPDLSWRTVSGLVVVMGLSLLIGFWVALTIGCLSLVLGTSGPLDMAWHRLTLLLGGGLLPLDFYPDQIQRVAEWLPFRLSLYDPARLVFGVENGELLSIVSAQAGWIFVLAVLAGVSLRLSLSGGKLGGS
jgi:ABC-2 type transport system permease protein